MTTGPRFPIRLVIGLAVAIALDTALQLVWKTGIVDLPETTSLRDLALAVVRNPIFVLIVVLMAAQLLNWVKVLDHADLSYAKPFTSLSYVTVCVLSVVLLGEHIAPLQIVGILIVVAGVWCVSQTGRVTPPFKAVSTAFPITSLSFVMVTLLSAWLLGERVTPLRWAGVGLILIGTSLIVAPA